MLRTPRLLVVALGVAAALCWNASLAARAGEEEVRKHFDVINSTTGKDVINAQFQSFLKHEDAKKLVAYAHSLAKMDPKLFTYNGAYILSQLARAKKNVAASEALFRVCTKQAADLESTQKLLQAYGGLIELLYENKKYKESEKVCREVLELETGPGKPRLVLALVPFGGQLNFMPMQNFDSAQPLQFPVRRLMIQSVAKQGKYDEALRMAQDLVNQKNHWLTRDIHAWVLREAGRFADAAKAYEDILNDVLNEKNLDPEDRADYEDRYRYLLSNLYVETKQVQKGIDQLRTLVQRHPNEPGYLNDLGYIMADHDMNLDEAERMIRKALELDRQKRKDDPGADKRDNGAYLDSLGWVLYKQKKYKEAKEHLLKAIEDPQSQHIEIYDHLGDVSLALNEREAALKYWQKGAELASESRRDQERKTRVMEKIKQHSN